MDKTFHLPLCKKGGLEDSSLFGGVGEYLLVTLIEWYQKYLAPFLGMQCRFEPSCSLYAKTALLQFGIWKGTWLALKRLSRCHPFCEGGYDPI